MEDQREETEQNDPTPLTDEELAEFQQKENRKVGIIWTIIDFTGSEIVLPNVALSPSMVAKICP